MALNTLNKKIGHNERIKALISSLKTKPMKQLFFIVLALFALARIQEKEADKVDDAICYVNANAGNGTDAEIEKAIQKAAKLYKLSVAETEELYQLNNK